MSIADPLLRPIQRHVAQDFAGVLDVNPVVVVIRDAVEDVEAQVVGGIDTALAKLRDVTPAAPLVLTPWVWWAILLHHPADAQHKAR